MIAWAQDDEEAAMVDILSLLKEIRQANLDEKEIYEITKDQCPEVGYKDVTIGEDKLSYLGIKCTDDFEPTEEEQGNVEFVDWHLENGTKIKIMPDKRNKTYLDLTLGKAIDYKFYEAIEHDPPMVNEQSGNKLFEFLILEKDMNDFEKYLFPTPRDIKIAEVLTSMEQYLGNPYNYGGGGGESKTSLDSAGTAEMDCSEFMCRFLQELGLFETVPIISTTMLSDPNDFADTQYGSKLQYIPGSDKDDFIPQPGDVFEWSRGTDDGHTGIVVQYIKSSDYVVVMESIGCKEPCSNDLTLNPDRGCCKVVKSTYKRIGKSLQGHTGWKGYYRPVIE